MISDQLLRYYIVVNIVALFIFAWDKFRAMQKNKQRVSENKFYILSCAGAWPAILLGIIVLRHKSRKMSFKVFFLLSAIFHLILHFFIDPIL